MPRLVAAAMITITAMSLAACQAAPPDRTDELIEAMRDLEQAQLITACEVAQLRGVDPTDTTGGQLDFLLGANGCDELRRFNSDQRQQP
jgi:hypothetical protein